MSKRRNSGFNNVDLQTLSFYLGLMGIGWIMILAASQDSSIGFEITRTAAKQGVFIGLSFAIILIISFIDWKFWRTVAYVVYAFSMLLLLAVPFLGNEVKGATSWFIIAGFSFQPSELAKFGTCLAVASYMSTYNTNLREFRHQIIAFGLILLPMGLIMLQPDLGSTVVFTSFLILFFREGLSSNFYIVLLTIVALFIIGLMYTPYYVILGFIMLGNFIFIFNMKNRKPWMYGFVAVAALTILGLIFQHNYYRYIFAANLLWLPILSFLIWRNGKKELVTLLTPLLIFGGALTYVANYTVNEVLKPHQSMRINAWLNPSKVSRDNLYNLNQSKLAIGSGGTYGKGFLEGEMTKYNYVPENTTDFIFSTIGEEQGFIGVFGIIAIYLLFLLRITVVAERQRSDFSRQYAYGVVGILWLHFFVNIGMTMGLVLIIGIPLPFISYGGSSLLAFSLMIGVLLKLDSNRYSI